MLSDASYAIWGGAFAALATLFLGIWVVNGVKRVKQVFQVRPEFLSDGLAPQDMLQDAQHRALMFVMNQKTDSILAALATTIERERQKLGVVVRNPSTTEEIRATDTVLPAVSTAAPSAYAKALSLAQSGTPVEAIARELDLSEAEVSLVMRLDAA